MLPQELVYDRKRERCAIAVAELAQEHGAHSLTMARIIARTRIGRKTFYELFDGVDDGLEFACKLGDERLAGAIESGAQEQGTWERRVDRSIESLLTITREQPLLAELSLVHRTSIIGAPRNLKEEATTAALVALLKQGRPEREPRRERIVAAEELIAGGIVGVVASRLRRGEADSLMELREGFVTLALTKSASS